AKDQFLSWTVWTSWIGGDNPPPPSAFHSGAASGIAFEAWAVTVGGRDWTARTGAASAIEAAERTGGSAVAPTYTQHGRSYAVVACLTGAQCSHAMRAS